MHVKRLAWLGTRTDKLDETTAFFREVLGLPVVYEEPGFAMHQLPDADRDFVEVFGSDHPGAALYTTGPVVGLLVDDITEARAELEVAGIELLDAIQRPESMDGYAWFHFRGPDGNVYAVVQGSQARFGLAASTHESALQNDLEAVVPGDRDLRGPQRAEERRPRRQPREAMPEPEEKRV